MSVFPGLFERQILLKKGAVWKELGCLCCPSLRAHSRAVGLIFVLHYENGRLFLVDLNVGMVCSTLGEEGHEGSDG